MAYADYEYETTDGFYRLEKELQNNWVWRYFPNEGDIISSNDMGEFFKLKREAKSDALDYIKRLA